MGKKSIFSSTKNSPKHEKKQQINSLVKILRPKVYITDSSNFKKLVQELTGNNGGSYSPVSLPPPCPSAPSNAVHIQMPFMDAHVLQDQYHHHHQEDHFDNSLDSLLFDSCFSSPVEGSSPDTGLPDSFIMQDNSEKINDLSSQYKDLESFLMGMDTVAVSSSYSYDSCFGYGMMMNMQQEVCGVHDHAFMSSFI